VQHVSAFAPLARLRLKPANWDFLFLKITLNAMIVKLFGMDQMLEKQVNALYGEDNGDPKRNIAYNDFMVLLESTVNDLAKSFLLQGGDDKEISFGRLQIEVEKETRPMERK